MASSIPKLSEYLNTNCTNIYEKLIWIINDPWVAAGKDSRVTYSGLHCSMILSVQLISGVANKLPAKRIYSVTGTSQMRIRLPSDTKDPWATP